jgi:hypothetical protein
MGVESGSLLNDVILDDEVVRRLTTANMPGCLE